MLPEERILRGDLPVPVNLHISRLAGTSQTPSDGCEEEFFQHEGVGLSGRQKAVNAGANYGEADRG